MSLRAYRLVALAFVSSSCLHNDGSKEPISTAWLTVCGDDGECVEGSCICGVCTKACEHAIDCADGFQGSCVPSSSEAGRVQCREDLSAPDAFCLPSCEGAPCSGPFGCYGGVCVVAGGDGDGDGGTPAPDAGVEVDGVTFTAVMEQTTVAVLVSTGVDRRRCGSSRLEKNDDGESVPLIDERPPRHDNPGYYLDARYVEPSDEACDEIECVGSSGLGSSRHTIGSAYEYVKLGRAPAPAGAANVGELVDLIETRAFSGDLYVYFNYSDGLMCEDREVQLELTVPEEGVCCPVAEGGCTLDGPTGGWARSRDECSPAPRPAVDDAWTAEGDPHGCLALEYHPEVCCGCVPSAEQTFRECAVEEPCAEGSADGSRNVAWDEVSCILEGLASAKAGRYIHETRSTFAHGTMGARHTFLVGENGSIRYARVEYSSSIAGVSESEDNARLGTAAAGDFFSECLSVIATDQTSELAWRCAFGDGTASTPSHLAWIDPYSNAGSSCD